MKNYKENYDYYNVEKVDSIKQLLESAAADAGDSAAAGLGDGAAVPPGAQHHRPGGH